jgi:hypothetical protein
LQDGADVRQWVRNGLEEPEPTYRERLEGRYDDLRSDLLLLAGTQPEHDIDPVTLNDAALVETGKALARRLQVLRDSELAYQQARITAEQMSAAAAAAATEVREANRARKRAHTSGYQSLEGY